MANWRDRVSRLTEQASAGDNSDNRDTSLSENGGSASIVPIVPIVTGALPLPLSEGLDRLRSMAAPRIKQPKLWREIVNDALRLSTDGHAAQALGLGWEPLQLWGCSPAIGGNEDLEGLAVWLAGREVRVLSANYCAAVNGPGSVAFFNRRSAVGAVFLWELGDRGR